MAVAAGSVAPSLLGELPDEWPEIPDDELPTATRTLSLAATLSLAEPSPATQRSCFHTLGGGKKRVSDVFIDSNSAPCP